MVREIKQFSFFFRLCLKNHQKKKTTTNKKQQTTKE